MNDYIGEFEVHVTVRPPNPTSFVHFSAWCVAHNFKSVRIVLARGEHVEQPMATWWRSDTTLPAVLAEANRMIGGLERAAIPVVRLKIEAAVDNFDVPQFDIDPSAQDDAKYFEHHVKLLRDATADRAALLQVCAKFGAHLSRNAWRDDSRGQEERFVTMRCYRVGRATAEERLQRLLAALNELGERIIEVESEYAVYDSNVDLDAGWLPKGRNALGE